MVLSAPTGNHPNPTGSQAIEGHRNPSQHRQGDWVVIPIHSIPHRVLLFLALVVFVFFVGRKAVLELIAERMAQNPTIPNLQRAIHLAPGDARYHYFLGQVLEGSFDEANWKMALEEYEKAVRLNPHNAFYWLQLARSYEFAERTEDARRAIEQAARAGPSQPLIAWQVANFYLRHDNAEEALRQFGIVLRGSREDPSLIQAVFDLAWQATQNNRWILDVVIPHNAEIEFGYLNFLLARGRLGESVEVWNRIARDQVSFRVDAVFPLIDALIAAQRVDEAQEVWKQLLHLLRLEHSRVEENNLISNGGFEADILNGGFSWRFVPLEHVGLQFDPVIFHALTRSIYITFDGKQNVAYNHFYQFVPVQPKTQYRFRGWMRAEQITTDTGPHFEIADYYAPSPPIGVGDPVVGSSPWQETSLVFRTGPNTRLLWIGVVRIPSRKFDNRIEGRIWIDDLSLKPFVDVGQIPARAQPAE